MTYTYRVSRQSCPRRNWTDEKIGDHGYGRKDVLPFQIYSEESYMKLTEESQLLQENNNNIPNSSYRAAAPVQVYIEIQGGKIEGQCQSQNGMKNGGIA